MFEKRKAILQEALKCKDIKKLNKRNFLKAWKALAFLNNALHPDEVDNPDGGWLAEKAETTCQRGFPQSKNRRVCR